MLFYNNSAVFLIISHVISISSSVCPSRAIVGSAYCKTNEVYQGQTIIEDLGPGQYNIGISSYGE